jgi:Amt family ammonium transporter
LGGQVAVQLIGVGVTVCNVGVLTFIILELVDAMVGQRVSKQEEKVALDMATHNERPYNLMKS